MKNLKVLLFLLATLSLSIFSCKKDKSTTELLTDGSWKLTAATINPGIDLTGSGPIITDFYAQFDACEKDDLTIFKSGGIVNYDEGATKCDPTDPQTDTGTWVLSADEKTLTLDGDSQTILSLTGSELKVSSSFDDGSGINYTLTITFRH